MKAEKPRPYGVVLTCPACGVGLAGPNSQHNRQRRYSTDKEILINNRWVDTATVSYKPDPKLLCECAQCGYKWQELCAEPEEL